MGNVGVDILKISTGFPSFPLSPLLFIRLAFRFFPLCLP